MYIAELLVNISKQIEGTFYFDKNVLQNFWHTVQLDRHSCGVQCTKAILLYFDVKVEYEKLYRQLKTNTNGTSPTNIKKTLKAYGLKSDERNGMTISDLKSAIDEGCPVLISTFEGEHFSCVYGYSSSRIFVMNPSLNIGSMGTFQCAVPLREFRATWDKWGLMISRK